MMTVGYLLVGAIAVHCSPHAVSSLSKREDEVPVISPVMNFKNRKTIKGHRGRILHFDWSPDKNHVMTAGQVGVVCTDCPAGVVSFIPCPIGWLCFDLERLHWSEGDCYSDDLSLRLGLCICTLHYIGCVWVRRWLEEGGG